MAAPTPATAPPTSVLSQDQVEAYLAHIGLPSAAAERKPTLPFLAALLEHQICAVPYENLGMHYSRDKVISLDVRHLYDKCVGTGIGRESRGRGGYCLEGTLLFNHVLRALGFHAWVVGARARVRVNGVPSGDFTGWMHTVNIVQFPDGSRYMADVAYGGDLSTKPLLLDPRPEGTVSHNSIGAQQVRLVRGSIPGMLSGEKLWLYEYRNDPAAAAQEGGGWNTCFAFTEAEFLPQDLDVMNVYTSRDPRCFLASSVLVVRFLRRDDGADCKGSGGIYGKRMLVNAEVKENLGGKTTVIRTCRTEAERVDALRELLGIELTDDEVAGIKGTMMELKG